MVKVSWGKEQRIKAKADGKGLFAAACDTREGRYILGGLLPHELAAKVPVFVNNLYQSKDPLAAFVETWPGLIKPDAEWCSACGEIKCGSDCPAAYPPKDIRPEVTR